MHDMRDVWDQVGEVLDRYGINFRIGPEGPENDSECTVMCLAGDMKTTVAEMGRMPRDQVVMVRIDESTKRALDDWVATGAVKSRSEAAALFMREGVKVRSGELEELREALDDVGRAKQRLEEMAKQVIGAVPDPKPPNDIP